MSSTAVSRLRETAVLFRFVIDLDDRLCSKRLLAI